MSNNKIAYKYFKGWDGFEKEGYDEFTYTEACEKYKNRKPIFIVAQKENEDKPFAFINSDGTFSLYINFLNSNLDRERELLYQTLTNIDKNRIFLIKNIIRTFDYGNNNLMNNIFTVDTYSFAYCDPKKMGVFHWIIRDDDKIECINYNGITKSREKSILNKTVSQKDLWEDIPEFGNWDYFLRDDINRIKFEEIKE